MSMTDNDTSDVQDEQQGNTSGAGTDGKSGADGDQDRSLMSRSADDGSKDESQQDGQDGKKPEGDKDAEGKDKEEDPSAKVPEKPEGYDLKFAPETQVDEALLDGFRKTAVELGLTQGQAQKLGSMYEAHMVNAGKLFVEAQTKALLEARKGWEADIAKRPAYEADLGRIQSCLRQFGDRELYDLLDQTNLGSHPKMFDFMAKVGKALAEPGFRGAGSGEEKSAAEVLYPGMNH